LAECAIFAEKGRGLESRLDAYTEFARHAENSLDHSFTHAEIAQLLGVRLRSQQPLGALVIPAVGGVARRGQRDERLERFAAAIIHGGSVQCAALTSCRARAPR